MNKYQIAYFSGTGCTALTASCLRKALAERDCESALEKIGGQVGSSPSTFDVLILMFPLHSFNAPWPVNEWLKKLGSSNGRKAAVISVSGGGDVIPNTAGRVGVIKILEKKGYDVFYENSLVMPSNIAVATPEPLAAMMIQVLPDKTGSIAEEIIDGLEHQKRRRVSPPIIDRFFSMVCKIEGRSLKSWGKSINITEDCDGCGLCAKQCQTGNITMWAKPTFGTKCCMCLGCYYACPKSAMKPGKGKSFIIKNGFSLKEIEKAASDSKTKNAEDILAKFKAGYLWSGVKKYLLEAVRLKQL